MILVWTNPQLLEKLIPLRKGYLKATPKKKVLVLSWFLHLRLWKELDWLWLLLLVETHIMENSNKHCWLLMILHLFRKNWQSWQIKLVLLVCILQEPPSLLCLSITYMTVPIKKAFSEHSFLLKLFMRSLIISSLLSVLLWWQFQKVFLWLWQ